MLYEPRKIRHHINGDNKNSANRAIAIMEHGAKPFLSLDVVQAGDLANDVPMSPDSGTAIIAFLVAGEAHYSDSTHNKGTLKKNDVLWMLSGSGIQYSLKPTTHNCISVKLRVALSPALESAPAQSIHLKANLVEHEGPVQVLLGNYKNARGGFALPALINYLLVSLSAGQEWIYETPPNHQIAWVAVIKGNISTSDHLVSAEHLAIYENSNKRIRFLADKDSVFLVGSSVEYTHDLVREKYATDSLDRIFVSEAF